MILGSGEDSEDSMDSFAGGGERGELGYRVACKIEWGQWVPAKLAEKLSEAAASGACFRLSSSDASRPLAQNRRDTAETDAVYGAAS